MSGTVRNFINKTHLFIIVTPHPHFNFLTQVGWVRRSPRTQPVLASRPLSIKHNSCLMMYGEKGYRMSCSQKGRVVLSLQHKLKACRVSSPNIHNHKLNTSNLEVHTLTVYHYIVHKGTSFTLFFPCNFAYLSAEHIFDLASKQDHR